MATFACHFIQRQFVQPVVRLSAKFMDWTGDKASIGAVILIGFKIRTKSDLWPKVLFTVSCKITASRIKQKLTLTSVILNNDLS